jgi:hypothetical protein
MMEDTMRPWIAITACMLALVAAGQAKAFERGPVCRESTVVDEMTREIRSRSYYAEVDPRLVTEQPTTDSRVVRCQVCVQMSPYDTMRFGDRPIQQCQAHGFEILILTRGFVVRDLR